MPIPDIADMFDDFIGDAEDLLGDEGRAYAENIARNLTEGVRQPRNALEAGITGRKSKPDLYDTSSMDLTPQQQRNLEASFKSHLKAIQRRVADKVGQQLKSQTFMGISPDKDPVVLKLDEHAAGNQPNLGYHPHDKTLSIPVPPGYEDVAPMAARLSSQTIAARKKLLAQLASGDEF